MKDYIIIALFVIIVLVIISRRMSGMSPAPSSNCGPKTILKDRKCRDIYSDVYPNDGPIVGDRKYCCA